MQTGNMNNKTYILLSLPQIFQKEEEETFTIGQTLNNDLTIIFLPDKL